MLRYAESKCNTATSVHSNYNTLMKQWWYILSLMLEVITPMMMEQGDNMMGSAQYYYRSTQSLTRSGGREAGTRVQADHQHVYLIVSIKSPEHIFQ